MVPPHIVIALLSAGIALFSGLVSLFTGLHKDGEKVDLVFGILCIAIVFFFLFPPIGFILFDQAPYPAEIIIKRIFNACFFMLFPWFVFFYTGYRNKTLPVAIAVAGLLSYILMAFAKQDSHVPLWVITSLSMICLSLIHGFAAVKYQFKTGSRVSAVWFRSALFIYLLLFVVSLIYQLNIEYFIGIFHQKIFYPINLFPLSFIIIMGVRLRTNSLERYRLEKMVRSKNVQWESLMQNLQQIIVHADQDGRLIYINPYGVSLLHYKTASELIGKNWFDYFMPGPDALNAKAIYKEAAHTIKTVPHFKNQIVTKDGEEKTITWTVEPTFDKEGRIAGLMSFGSDVSEQETAFQQIQSLKSELEKENLMLKGEPLPEWMQKEIIGRSDAIRYAIHKAQKVATSQATVLLEGETGVGKELFADLIQRSSLRNTKPFVKINCGALPAELIEDELFGHEKGAFTGAVQARKGRFEIADGGTIFLDEIGELPLALQPKMLRVLQTGSSSASADRKQSKSMSASSRQRIGNWAPK